MSPKAWIAVAVIVLLVVCCGAVACTPVGNSVPFVSVDHDSSKSKSKKSKKSNNKSRSTRTKTRR